MMRDRVILVLTNEEDVTTDFVVRELQGTDFVRLNTEQVASQGSLTYEFSKHGVEGEIVFGSERVKLGDIRSVYCRRMRAVVFETEPPDEGVRAYVGQEFQALVAGLSRLIEVPWLNHPLAVTRAESKLLQLSVAQQCGFRVPGTIVTNSSARARAFATRLGGRLAVKALGASRVVVGNEERILFTTVLAGDEFELLDDAELAPFILQEFVEKTADVRVTVVGERVFAVKLDSQAVPGAAVDWRAAETLDVPHSPYQLPAPVEAACVRVCKLLGLHFGAIDLAIDAAGDHVFFEINPNGQWAWLQIVTGLPIAAAIADLLRYNAANH